VFVCLFVCLFVLSILFATMSTNLEDSFQHQLRDRPSTPLIILGCRIIKGLLGWLPHVGKLAVVEFAQHVCLRVSWVCECERVCACSLFICVTTTTKDGYQIYRYRAPRGDCKVSRAGEGFVGGKVEKGRFAGSSSERLH
jgi:hypothetical protein